jgi:protein O-mannosyl-transferase
MPELLQPLRRIPPRLGALLALAAATTLLLPMLHGAFLLDDLPNLAGLARLAAGSDGLISFVTTGLAGPGGRPLSLLTFALQAEHWSAHPLPFKAVNLALHLATGYALYLLLEALLLPRHAAARRIALVVALLWLVHPLQLSTVAYVVQRMTELAALAVLLGLLAFVRGRAQVQAAPERAGGYLLAFGGLAAAGAIGVLCKESAALILPLALLVDHVLPIGATPPARWRLSRRLLLELPLAAALLACAWYGADWLAEGYATRDFTLFERVLSQPRALVEYFWIALWPHAAALGVFHDDFATSTSWTEPWTTLPALFVLASATVAAVLLRRRAALVAFALLWFLANHLLESTLLPLELYFEHRNYLALAGPLLLVALAAESLIAQGGRQARVGGALLLAFALGIALGGAREARSWGEPMAQSERWAAQHPASLRAQSYLANMRKLRGDLEGAAALYVAVEPRFADGASFTLDWLELGCSVGDQPLPSRALLLGRAARAKFSYGPGAALDRMAARFERGTPCPRVELGLLRELTAALLANPAFRRDIWVLHLVDARLARLADDRPAAIAAMRRAFEARAETEYALTEARWRFDAGDLAGAAEALGRARAALPTNPLRRQALAVRIADLEAQLQAAETGRNPIG